MEATSLARPIISPSFPSYWHRPLLLSPFPSSRISQPPLSAPISVSFCPSIGSEKNRTFVACSSVSSEGELPIEKRYPTFPTVYDINQILDIVPHRYPFLFVDRIIELNPGVSAVAIKNVTINDNFFPGHVPEQPIMPGVLIVEVRGIQTNGNPKEGANRCPITVEEVPSYVAGGQNLNLGGGLLFLGMLFSQESQMTALRDLALAQVGGIMMQQSEIGFSRDNFFFAGIDKVKFRKPVVAGNTLVMRMTLLRRSRGRVAIAKMEGKAYVGGEVVCEGRFLIAGSETE